MPSTLPLQSTTVATAALESDLKALIEPDRAAFVAMFSDRIRKGLESFLSRREGRKTVREVYPDGGEPIGLRGVTDYYAMETVFYNSRRRAPLCITERAEDRQEWPVSFLPDADGRILAIAEKMADEQIQTFLARALEKLGPVVERAGCFKALRNAQSRLNGMAWVGELRFVFDGNAIAGMGCPLSFTARLKVITNFSGIGRPYAQYPMTFHDVRLPGESSMTSPSDSIENIWASVGYVPPPAPTGPVRRWKKLVSGSVVLIDGRPVLVDSPGAAKKVGIPEDAEQVARIEAHVYTNPFRGKPGAHVRVEYASNGDSVRHELSDEDAAPCLILDGDGQSNKATALARRAGFNMIFGKDWRPG